MGTELTQRLGRSLVQEDGEHSVVAQFSDQVREPLSIHAEKEWSAEIEVFDESGRRFLFCRGTVLRDTSELLTGRVIVIDDMTTLISAQRDAAWSEVARRLAHEIKNPLTPIRLSAERLRHKFGRKLEGSDVELMERLTHTIENQVDAMKGMVDAFADYATTPKLTLVPTSVNELVREVVDLYGSSNEAVTMNLSLSQDLPVVSLDLPRMRQLIHNLIKNALEAQQSNVPKVVTLTTRVGREGTNDMLQIIAEDEGTGFPLDMMDRLFEPYVSSKPKGTGLGLAIVKKIVEEHSGTIRAENRPVGGAAVIVSLPYPSSLQLRGDAA